MPLRPLGSQQDPRYVNRVADDNFRNIDNRFRTNVVRQAAGNAIIQGKLPYDGGYGTMYFDENGVPRYIIGILPDGTLGERASIPGIDVTQATQGQLAFESDFSEWILYKENGNVAIVRSNSDWSGSTANIIKEGKLPYSGGYGSLHYDSTDARILIGIDPDGDMNIHISKPGEDVVTDVFS